VPIVGLTSASPLGNKSSFNPRAILMSPSAVPHADRQGRQSGMEVVVAATGSLAKCFLPYAPSAAKTPKCLLSLPMAGQSIVAIVTVKSDRVDNAGLTMDIHGPGILGPCMFMECGGVSSQWESRYVKVTLKILCCVAFKRWCK
jgi:hypothetical protein